MVTSPSKDAGKELQATAPKRAISPGLAYTLRQLTGYALKLGTVGFGGPLALVGYMHRDLVERLPEPVIVVAAGLIGLVAHPLVRGGP